MVKKLAVILLAALTLLMFTACGGNQNNPPAEKTEEELMAENELFQKASEAADPFEHNGIQFRITSAVVNLSPNEENPNKTIKVYVDYPYEIKTVTYEHFSVIDPAGDAYVSLLPDGLDYMGPYREEGKDGRVTFIVPRKFDNYLLKVQMPGNEPDYVHFDLGDY